MKKNLKVTWEIPDLQWSRCLEACKIFQLIRPENVKPKFMQDENSSRESRRGISPSFPLACDSHVICSPESRDDSLHQWRDIGAQCGNLKTPQ